MDSHQPTVFKLDNGLKVILEESHSSPVVALQMWVKVGSADEEPEDAGISHVFEHMLFKGTKRRAVGEIAREVEALGGNINAFTSFDHTVYHITIAGRYLSEALDILADAVQNSSFDPDELSREIPVVLEELHQALDSPGRRIMYALFDLAYTAHPYRRPVIGEIETISGITREKLLEVFEKWYVPENMTLIVTGDFQTTAVEKAIEKAFRSFRFAQVKKSERAPEPEQKELRVRIEESDFEQAYIGLAFHCPRLSDPEVYSVDLLMDLLGSGQSSRLYQEVKSKRRLVYSIGGYAYTPKDPGLCIIDAALEPENIEKAITETFRTLFQVRYHPFSPSELRGAQHRLESDFLYGAETVQGRARQLGIADTVYGSLRFAEDYVQGIRSTTVEDIQATARRLLRADRFSLVVLVPSGRASVEESELQSSVHRIEKEVQGAYTRPVQRESHNGVTRVVFPSGMVLLVKRDASSPIVAVRAAFLGGLRFEAPENNGISNLMAEVWTKGTSHRGAAEIARAVESMAASINGFSGNDAFGLEAEFLAQNWNEAWDLFSEILTDPSFPEEEVEKQRTDVLGNIRSRKDDVTGYTFDLFRSALFQEHPYGMTTLGTEASVQKLTRDDLLDYYGRYAVPQNLVLSVVGDVEVEEVVQAVQQLDSWATGRREWRPPSIVEWKGFPSSKEIEERVDKNQAHLVLGFLGTPLRNEDRYPLAVLDAILSGQGGRLFGELRDKQSLGYVVTSVFHTLFDSGYFALYIGTSPEKVDAALEGMKREIERLLKEGVTDGEVQRARRYLIGSHEIALQSKSSQAADLALNERYGLGWNYSEIFPQKIESVTREKVEAVAKRYLDLDRSVTVIVRP